jgi:hypothetical protein
MFNEAIDTHLVGVALRSDTFHIGDSKPTNNATEKELRNIHNEMFQSLNVIISTHPYMHPSVPIHSLHITL